MIEEEEVTEKSIKSMTGHFKKAGDGILVQILTETIYPYLKESYSNKILEAAEKQQQEQAIPKELLQLASWQIEM